MSIWPSAHSQFDPPVLSRSRGSQRRMNNFPAPEKVPHKMNRPIRKIKTKARVRTPAPPPKPRRQVVELEEQLRKLWRAVEQNPASIIITDVTGAIEYVNPKFTQVTGYSADEVRGQNPRVLNLGELPAEAYQQLSANSPAGPRVARRIP